MNETEAPELQMLKTLKVLEPQMLQTQMQMALNAEGATDGQTGAAHGPQPTPLTVGAEAGTGLPSPEEQKWVQGLAEP